MEFHDYVHLQLSSINNEWSYKPVCALIALGLCSNILLGLPFLTHNNIVIDHAARTTIDKESGFDLLDENSRMPHKTMRKMIPPKERVKQILMNCKTMIEELKTKCAERLVKLESRNELRTAKPVNTITAIKTTIERLASKDKLNKLEETIKEEFKEIFLPIPHISMLPTRESV